MIVGTLAFALAFLMLGTEPAPQESNLRFVARVALSLVVGFAIMSFFTSVGAFSWDGVPEPHM